MKAHPASSLEDLFKTAEICANLSTQMCLKFKHGIDPQKLKADKSWVTSADQEIERELKKIILEHHPDHCIFGEEEGGTLAEDDEKYTWVIDPIDGTFSFIHNIPFYSSLIAVLKGNEPIVGFATIPGMGITLSAIKGKGAFVNKQPYQRPLLVGNPHIEIIATADPYRFCMAEKQGALDIFYGPEKKSRTYTDALGYYLLLMGSVRAFVDPKVEIWDVAPYYVILPEAGFAIHAWDGNKQLTQGKGNCISYALDDKNNPINSNDVIQITSQFS